MITKCRICGSDKLQTIINLGNQALSGHFPLPTQDVPCAPLELVRCTGDCGLVQLKNTYDLVKMYGDNYGYRSGLNKSMVKHLKLLVNKIISKTGKLKGKLIVDIGSNDGTLLGFYPMENIFMGIDPTSEKFAKYYKPYIKHYPQFFSDKLVKETHPTLKAKVVTSIAMFYDLEDPTEFMRQIHNVLEDDGVWVMEQSYMPLMIRNTLYDTICHEHIEYYGLKQIYYMAGSVGLKIIDVEFNDTNGGSFMVMLAKKESKHKECCNKISEILLDESEFDKEKVYVEFKRRVEMHKDELINILKNYKTAGKKVLGYGASTKGNVMLSYCEITPDLLPYIGEVNPDKFGKVTPGTKIPIISEQEAREMGPDYFLVLPWHFKKMILTKERKNKVKYKYKLIFPLPRMEIK